MNKIKTEQQLRRRLGAIKKKMLSLDAEKISIEYELEQRHKREILQAQKLEETKNALKFLSKEDREETFKKVSL